MKKLFATAVAIAALSSSLALAEPAKNDHVVITRNGAQASMQGPEQWFTGNVRVDPLFAPKEGAPITGAYVTFEPGARSAWHIHPTGQHLIVTSGKGWTQEWDGPITEILPGDVIWCPPGVKHWHGATPTTPMTHLTLTGTVDGKNSVWLEKVSDEQYRK